MLNLDGKLTWLPSILLFRGATPAGTRHRKQPICRRCRFEAVEDRNLLSGAAATLADSLDWFDGPWGVKVTGRGDAGAIPMDLPGGTRVLGMGLENYYAFSPTDAIGVINRLDYRRNDAVIETGIRSALYLPRSSAFSRASAALGSPSLASPAPAAIRTSRSASHSARFVPLRCSYPTPVFARRPLGSAGSARFAASRCSCPAARGSVWLVAPQPLDFPIAAGLAAQHLPGGDERADRVSRQRNQQFAKEHRIYSFSIAPPPANFNRSSARPRPAPRFAV